MYDHGDQCFSSRCASADVEVFSHTQKEKNNQAEILLFCFVRKKTTQKTRGRDVKHWHFPMWLRKDLIQEHRRKFLPCDLGRAEALSNTETERTTDYYHSNANWMTQNSRNVLGITPWNSQLTQAFPQKRQPGILHHTSVIQITQTEWRKTESSFTAVQIRKLDDAKQKRVIKDGML